MVVKKSGRRVPFDRDKLMRSVQVALRKRAVEPERIERMVNGVVRQLESQTDGDIPTERIGELVMEGLKAIDDVAYVRFASVYRNFREARDFNAIVGELQAEPEAAPERAAPRAGARSRRPHERARLAEQAADDERWMQAALNLGERSLGLAAPNPSVGALLVRDGAVVGRGVTSPGGRPHAERIALAEAGEAARGATLYVTLEPCSHFGASPPCADAVVEAGVARVVAAIEDPNPEVAGRGSRASPPPGSPSTVGPGADQARRDHLGHIRRVTEGRPCVTLKLAETADGFASGGRTTRGSDHRPDRQRARADLRSTHEAIMVGVETALVDDPALTVRLPGLDRKPWRVVLDTRLRLPLRSRLATGARDLPTLVVAGPDAAAEAEAGCAHAASSSSASPSTPRATSISAQLCGRSRRAA